MSSLYRLFVVSFLFLPLLVGGACDCGPQPKTPLCQSHLDCLQGMMCLLGRCQPLPDGGLPTEAVPEITDAEGPACPSSCRHNSECSSCGSRRYCVQGACASCPSSCQHDSECSYCGSRLFCVQGVCNSCPLTCRSPQDCARCSGGRTDCRQGTCQRSFSCPASCASNADCAPCPNSRTHCRSGVCSAPPSCPVSCTADADCARCPGKTDCRSGVCSTPPPCPASCTADADCARCSNGKTDCRSGVCSTPPPCPASCTADADCARCSNGKTRCLRGVCSAPPSCPASCTADADCARCSNGRTHCRSGVCSTPPSCPVSCTADADCARCPNGRTSCIHGSCQSSSPTCPASCTSDAQCAKCPSGRTSCVHGVCALPPGCPSSCTADADCKRCPSSRRSCVRGVCGSLPPCPASCNADADCAPCGTAYRCQSGRCKIPSSSTGVGSACSASSPCSAGLICISIGQNKAVCFQDCTGNANLCLANTADGRTQCIEITYSSGKPVAVCLGESGKGGPCNYVGVKQRTCAQGHHPPLYCSKTLQPGTCLPSQIAKVGEKCNTSGDSSEPYRLCDTTKQLACDPATGRCKKIVLLDVDQRCGDNSTEVCRTGLLCVRFSSNTSSGLCLPEVASCSAGACTAGRRCFALSSGRGVCVKECASSPTLCPKGTACMTLGNYKVCGPDLSGSRAFGEICSETSSSTRCQKNLQCLRVSQSSQQGFCSTDCTQSGTCPTYTDPSGTVFKAICVNAGPKKYCLFPCGTPGQSCPNASIMSCQTIGSGGQYCLAP